uniref:C-type lectin domain-containing protein n=1 Tax=Panagrolaimus sp. ES5 TaxID=591445 RepID=A0AC34F684_9BILA
MFKILILLILFVTVKAACPNGTVTWHTDCYFLEDNNATGFPTAESACNSLGGHLASIHDGFSNALITNNAQNLFHGSTVSDFWIGYTNLMTSSNWTWMDNSPSDYTDWAPGQPSNSTDDNCASVCLTNGKWKTDDCFKPKPYVCKVNQSVFEVPTTTTTTTITTTMTKFPVYTNCTFPFTYFEPTHSCYGVGNWSNPLNWTLAEQYCQGYGAHLASVHSSDEQRFISSFVYVAQSYMWTGAFSNDGGKTWKWSDNTPWDFDPWISGYPNLNTSACAVCAGTGMVDFSCNTIFRTMCKKAL